MKTILSKLLVAGLLAAGVAPNALAQDTQSPKQDMKDAGTDTEDAAKKTGHATQKGTKKAAHKTAKKTKQGAQKVEDKTQPE